MLACSRIRSIRKQYPVTPEKSDCYLSPNVLLPLLKTVGSSGELPEKANNKTFRYFIKIVPQRPFLNQRDSGLQSGSSGN